MNWNIPSYEDMLSYRVTEVFAAGLRMHHVANTAYPIDHGVTMKAYRIPRRQVQQVGRWAWQEVERLGLYVHVPFCEQRCGYCEYTVLEPRSNADLEGTYFYLLQREYDLYRRALGGRRPRLIGFDIGGGTPAAVDAGKIEMTLEAARRTFYLPERVVISIETTPRIAAREPEKIEAYRKMGIGRISMGVQTIQPALLRAVGREAGNVATNRQAAENIRKAGFKQFNIDVMYGFAGQSLSSVAATLEHVMALEPEYVTLYRMRYKGTRLAEQAEGVDLQGVIAQARLAKEMLLAGGYAGWEGKNTFSRVAGEPGTSHYLTERVVHGTPYLGVGLGAQSLSEVTLAYNSGAADKRLEHYRRQLEAGQLPIQDIYHLSRPAAMGKMIAVSFYFGEINLESFRRKFGVGLEEAFAEEVEFVLHQGLMEYQPAGAAEAQTLRLTEWGEEYINGVIALFYSGAVKARLIERAMEARVHV